MKNFITILALAAWAATPLSAKDRELPLPETGLEVPAHFKYARETPGSFMIKDIWWKMFGDARLDALEEQALRNNQNLSRAVANIVEARAKARAVQSDLFPQISGSLDTVRRRTTDNGPVVSSRIIGDGFAIPGVPAGGGPSTFAGQSVSSTYSQFEGGIAIGYELDVFGRVQHAYAQAREQARVSVADREAVALSLTTEVANRYFTLRALDSQQAVLRETLDLRKQSLGLQNDRLKNGKVSQLEVAQAEVELANTESDLADSIRSRGEQENALALLCGQSASGFSLPTDPLTSDEPPAIPAAVPSTLLKNRPDLVGAEHTVIAASEGVSSAHAAELPSFNLNGDYGLDSATLDKLSDSDSRVWSLGLKVTIPIWDGGKNAANVRAAQARREASLAAYRQTALTAFREVEDALLDLRQRATQAEARARAVASARKVTDYSRERYDAGAIDYFNVIDAERNLLNARVGQVRTRYDRYAATIDLIRAIGGSYTPADPAK